MIKQEENKQPEVIDFVVNPNMCIGCGMCVPVCPTKSLEMAWSDEGFKVPVKVNDCDSSGECITVCPFNPFPEEAVKTETEIADIFLKDETESHPRIGKYNGLYAGYSESHRITSSSGGTATYIFENLFKQNIVQHVISVKQSNTKDAHYEFAISSSLNDILSASKTKYFPVSMDTALLRIKELEGKVAITGVACFVKAIRLAQYKDVELKEKISFIVGIICGGVKSRFFTEYLAEKSSVNKNDYEKPQFRIKNHKSTAGDYSFGCVSSSTKEEKSIRMKTVGDMWGTGLFKANACDFCDDVTTELADISLGDAWMPPYLKDGKGTNVIVTRSLLAKKIIEEGVIKKELVIDRISLESFLKSQKGSFNHRQRALGFRMKKKNIKIPKRFNNEKITIAFKIVQSLRMKMRSNSLKIWGNSPNAITFDNEIKKDLIKLKKFTKYYHYYDGIINRVFVWKKK